MFVYAVAFLNDRFVMVRNRQRGWEMPGGKVEPGEDFEKAVRREFYEESGLLFFPVMRRDVEGGKVFFGLASEPCTLVPWPRPPEIAEMSLFDSLPEKLSFPKEEYEAMLQEAKSAVERYINRNSIGDSASA